MARRVGIPMVALVLLVTAGCEFSWIQLNFVVQQEIPAKRWTRVFTFTPASQFEIRKGRYGVSGQLLLTSMNNNPEDFRVRLEILDEDGNTTETIRLRRRVTVGEDGIVEGCLRMKEKLEVGAGQRLALSVRSRLGLKNPGKPFHPIFNPLIWKAGCP